MFEFHPGIDRQNNVGVFTIHAPFVVLSNMEFMSWQHIFDDVIGPFRVADLVGIACPDDLCGAGHVFRFRQNLPSPLGCVDDQRRIAMSPEMNGFKMCVGFLLDLTAIDVGIKGLIEGVFGDPGGQTVEHRRFVIAGVAADVAARDADIPGQCGHQEVRSVDQIVVKIHVHAHSTQE